MKISLRFTGWLGLVLLLMMASCGTSNIGSIDAQDVQHNSSGVKLGGFEVIRYNADISGATLNDSLSLKLEEANGQQALIISVSDDVNTTNVLLDVRYDAAKVHPVRTSFDNLLGSEEQVIAASFLDKSGVAGMGQVAKGDFQPAALNGRFAVITFERGPSRSVSAAGGPYANGGPDLPFFNFGANTADDVANFTVDEVPGTSTTVRFTAGWQRGDGNIDGLVTVQDLTPIGLNFGKNVATQWTGLEADYNGDGVVSVQDLTTIGLHFQEGTDAYTVEVADTDASARTALADLAWGDKNAASAPADDTPGDPTTSIDWWEVAFTNASDVTLSELGDLDNNGNDDGFITLIVTPKRAGTDGVEGFFEIPAPGGGGGNPGNLQITGFKVSVVDGDSNEVILDNTNAQGTAVANASYTFTLSSISGTWTSDAGTGSFEGPVIDASDSASVDADMTQAHYDQAFAAAVNNASWAMSNGGAAGLRTAACDWITFGSPSPITGNPGAGTVFPDDDPESDAGSPEGRVLTTLPNAGTYPNDQNLVVTVPADIELNLTFDVTVDETAVLLGAATQTDVPLTELTLQIDSQVDMPMTWGTPGVPLDLTQTQLQLCEGDNPDGCWTPLIDFTFNDETVDPLDGGQYNIIDRGNGDYSIKSIVPGVQLNAGKFYVFRFNNSAVWSSLNKQGDGTPLETAPPPPAQDLIVVPNALANVSQGGPNFIQIFYDNPAIRRDDRITVDPFNGTADPTDPDGYNDLLKDGDEFTVEYEIPGGIFPQAQMIEGTDADGIVWDDPNNLEGQFSGSLLYTQPGRVVIDIAALRNIGDLEGTVTFAFKLFGKGPDHFPVGQATFTKTALGGFVSPLVGVDWGVNAYNRTGQVNKGDISFADKSVDGVTCGTLQPDVIFAQFSGGFVFDHEDNSSSNVYMYLEDVDSGLNQEMRINMVLTGITNDGDYLSMHVLQEFDFYDGLGPGQLIPGQSYDVYLDYDNNPMPAYYFGDTKRMTVTSAPL